MKLGGIDGCSAGWVIASSLDGKYELEIYDNFKSIISNYGNLDRILIDIPVGLSSKKAGRTIDAKLRQELKNRSSTVFNAPCRSAVYESDDKLARQFNIQTENKSLSIQSLAIRGKIKEVDEYLCENKSDITIIESHPELCFKFLNKSIVQSKKSTPEGVDERLTIIENYDPKLVDLYQRKLKEIKRKHAKKDDIIDAICLCLVNKLGSEENHSYLVDENAVDEKGIMIRIGYYQNRK
jgi:predicted RNase H-like nuclease